jgi:hypothetical protein
MGRRPGQIVLEGAGVAQDAHVDEVGEPGVQGDPPRGIVDEGEQHLRGGGDLAAADLDVVGAGVAEGVVVDLHPHRARHEQRPDPPRAVGTAVDHDPQVVARPGRLGLVHRNDLRRAVQEQETGRTGALVDDVDDLAAAGECLLQHVLDGQLGRDGVAVLPFGGRDQDPAGLPRGFMEALQFRFEHGMPHPTEK